MALRDNAALQFDMLHEAATKAQSAAGCIPSCAIVIDAPRDMEKCTSIDDYALLLGEIPRKPLPGKRRREAAIRVPGLE
ncbi:hypothetical protein PG999_001938 [Apiospora kogelbergensis]|uniref:Uncharacterized protein n=1 Tax=Apiospora kogelbergensis TaxID=1337665 RepID=A0AAW0R711_9PEZI